MKKPLFIITASILPFYALADAHLSPQIGLHYSGFSQYNNASQNISYHPRLGLRIGLSADSAINGVFLLQTGLFLTMQGGSQETTRGNSMIKESIQLNYVEDRTNFGYRFSTANGGGFFVTTGPFLRTGMWGSYQSKTIINGQEQNYHTSHVFGLEEDALYKLIDFGWNFGVGAMLPSGLYARIDYGIAFANIAKAAASKARNIDGFGITIGYHIDKEKRRRY